MIYNLGQVVVQNGAGSFSASIFNRREKEELNIPPFTCVFVDDTSAQRPDDKTGEYRVFVPAGAIKSQNSAMEENCECKTSYPKAGDWVRLPNGKTGEVWVYLYNAGNNVIKGYLSFEDDTPQDIVQNAVDKFLICTIPSIPNVQQKGQGQVCPRVVNGMQGRPVVVAPELLQQGVFQIVKTNDTVALANPYCMYGDTMRIVPVTGFVINPNQVLTIETTSDKSVLKWFDSVESMQSAQDEAYDSIITPLYAFDSEGGVKIDFRGIPNFYLWR